jgi:hypothetical protein
MDMTRRDPGTVDLFSEFAPAPVVERFSPERVRASRASARIARAVAEAIKEMGAERSVVAQMMSEHLGERVTAAMLDQYTSTANERNNIPAHRLIALLAITGDVRIVNAALHDTGFIALSAKYEPLIRREMLKEAGEKLAREQAAADAQWRAKR